MMTPEEKELLHLRKRLTTLFHKACADYRLIADGDHILIGLSGGKDSLALVEFLGRRSRIYVPRFRVSALHVSVENIGYQSDIEYLRSFCESHGVQFLHRTTRYDESSVATDNATDRRQKNHCFLCSWYRRKCLFEVAQELGCNKLAFGHHKDDILETLLMNMVSGGTFSTMPPLLQMQKFPLQIIRPLCLIEEADLRRYAQMSDYRQVPKLCPYEHESSRSRFKQLITELEQINPEVRHSLWASMSNIKTDYLPLR